MRTNDQNLEVAVLIPCYNEEGAIGKVVRDFRSKVGQKHRSVPFRNNEQRQVIASETGKVWRQFSRT
jgi:hypothetical protein